MSESQRESVSWTRRDCCLCVCEWGSGTELEGVEIAKRRGASNCFHFSVMTEEEREHRSAGSLRRSDSSGRTCWVYLFTSSSPGRLHSCVREYSCLSGVFLSYRREMSSLYSRSKDLSSRSRKSLSDSPPSSPSPSTKTFRVRASCVCFVFVTITLTFQ